MTATPPAVLGREVELAAIESFLTGVTAGRSGVLVLSGAAGIGKSTLWASGVAAASRLGFRVVRARPAQIETGLSFAALGDLLGPLFDDGGADLPEPQREALGAALLRAAAPAPPQPLGVSLGALHVLRTAAATSPLLVAVDDAPWIDEPTARTLEFAIRRLGDDRVGFLVARRAASPEEPLPRWLDTIPPEHLTRVDVGPLSLDATAGLLNSRLGLALTRPVLARLHSISGGTPLYAIELGRDLQARGTWDRPDALEVPRSLDRLVGARIAALPPSATEVALVAAALAEPTVSVIRAATGPEVLGAGLEAAIEAGILEVEGDAVRFSHPLLAAAAYSRARPDRRSATHARLATIVTDPEERARHLARATAGPDADVAAALEEAAGTALARGASEVAAALAEDAARLTPPDADADRRRRLLLAADDLMVSGDMLRADELLGTVVDGLPPGPLRADVLVRRARIALYLTALDRAGDHLREALDITADDPVRRVWIHALLAGLGYLSWSGWRHARFEMWEALRLAVESGDRALESQMLGHAGTWAFGLGRPWRPLAAEADALEVPIQDVPPLEHPDLQFARLFAREGEPDEARRRLERLIAAARAAGDWTSLPRLLVSLAAVEIEAGAWDRAAEIADDAEAGLLQSGEGAFAADLAILRLDLAVLRGDEATVRATIARIDETWALPKPLVRTGPPFALAALEIALGNASAALVAARRVTAEPGLGRLLPIRWETIAAIETEALVGLGRVDEALDRIRPVVRRARRRGPDAARAEAIRALALALSGAGDHRSANDAAEEAVAIHTGIRLPFRAARAAFTLGEVRRRGRHKGAARSAFEDALAGFSALGAHTWLERTRTELGRVAGRRPAGAPLTDTERRVAELAGAGSTNKEIAEALFMSVHTVEAHLTRIFRSLGVQSRTELARVDLRTDRGAGPQP